MEPAEVALLDTCTEFIFQPNLVDGAILEAVQLLRPSGDVLAVQRGALQAQLDALDHELARLASAVAACGHVTALFDAMREREDNRGRVLQELDGLDTLWLPKTAYVLAPLQLRAPSGRLSAR